MMISMAMAMKQQRVLMAISSSSASTLLGFHSHRSQAETGMIFFLHTSSSRSGRPKYQKGCSFTNIEDALCCFHHMIHMHPLPRIIEFNDFLSALVRIKHYGTVLYLSKQIELLQIERDVCHFSILINCYCRLLRVDFGFSVLGKIIKLGYEPNVVVFSTLINGLCIKGKIARAVEFFDEMVERGYQPNQHTYTTIIKGFCKIGKTPVAVGLLKKMDNAGCQPNVVTYSTLIDSLCKDRLVKEALDIFSEMKSKGIQLNVVTYNSLMHGLCNSDQQEEASTLFNEMMSFNIMPDVVTFNILVDTLCKKGKISEAQGIVKTMIEKGVEPNTVTYSSLMNGYLLQNRVFEARKVFDAMITKGCIPDVLSYNILINGFCKALRIDEAKQLFDEMSFRGLIPNTASYNTLISGLCRVGRVLEAKELFKDMHAQGCSQNLVTYSILVDGLSKQGYLDQALELFREMQNRYLNPDLVIYNILIDAMCKSGKLEDARELFLKLYVKGLLPDVRSWTSIISGLCREGLLDEAYKALRQMERDGCPPDDCTYNVIVRGFLWNNGASRAEQLFQEMFDRGFYADAQTRTLVADLLSKDDNLGLKRLLGESECCQGEKVGFERSVLIGELRSKVSDKAPLVHGHLFCVSSYAQILSLLVQDGFSEIRSLLHKIRECIEYVNGSSLRRQRFLEAINNESLQGKEMPFQDVLARWDTTFHMVENSLEFREAFNHLEQLDRDFKVNPSAEEWNKATSICECLKELHKSTSNFPTTSEGYFLSVRDVYKNLLKWEQSEHVYVRSIANRMKGKFDEYWGEASLALGISVVLNPSFKLELVEYGYQQIYGTDASLHLSKFLVNVTGVYHKYAKDFGDQGPSSSAMVDESPSSDISFKEWQKGKYERNMVHSQQNELHQYLKQPLEELDKDGNVLAWWQENAQKFPILGKMAHDFLAIPVSTVISKSSEVMKMISVHDGVHPEIAEALICGKDWLDSHN